MTTTGEIADFVRAVNYDDLSRSTRDALRKRLLDAVGVAVGAYDAEAVGVVRETVAALEDGGPCTLWGRDGTTASPVQATMHNTALTRYLDYMDSFLAPGETPHPSDNVAAVVAAGEYAGASGEELLEGIGVAYEVQGELAWNAPVRDRGFDHVTHTVISTVAGVAALLDLDREETRNAVGIAGTAHNALRVTRTGGINEWKGIASANAARNGAYAAVLAARGMEGPTNLFEGQKGWQAVIAGREFDVDLDPGCSRVHDTMTKRYVAETYAQSAVEAVVELAEREDLDPDRVAAIHLDTFAGAKLIIGGGEGSRYEVETRAQADHSLPYMLAAALIDRELTVDQYEPERIARTDVQRLLETVEVAEDPALTGRFEAGEMPAVVTVELDDGTVHRVEKDAFLGHPTRPMDWGELEAKFETMVAGRYDDDRRAAITEAIRTVDGRDVADLTALLA